MNLTKYDLNNCVESLIKQEGLNQHQIRPFNNFLDVGIKQIMEELFIKTQRIELNNKFGDNVRYLDYTIQYTNTRYIRPRLSKTNYIDTLTNKNQDAHNLDTLSNKKQIIDMMTPNIARKLDENYLFEVVYDIIVTVLISYMDKNKEKVEKNRNKRFNF